MAPGPVRPERRYQKVSSRTRPMKLRGRLTFAGQACSWPGSCSPRFQRLKVAMSSDSGASWTFETITGASPQGLPISAVDGDGNVYAVWHDNVRVYYSARPSSTGTWSSARVLSSSATATVWGSFGVANGTGKLGVAWYTKESTSDWYVHYVRVSSAHASDYHLSEEAIVHLVADGNKDHEVFRDFLSLAKKSDGTVLIAFSCNWTAVTVDPPPCTRDSKSHPMVAEQNGGPRL